MKSEEILVCMKENEGGADAMIYLGKGYQVS
jgi:hypothetical protein